MLDKKTQALMKELVPIGNSSVIEYPVTTISQIDKAILAFVDLEKLNEEKFEAFGIYYLSEFLSLLEFFPGASIKNENGIIHIEGDNSKQLYETTDLKQMESFKIPSTVVDKINEAPKVGTFNISKEFLGKIKKISSILDLKNMIVNLSQEESKLIVTTITENTYQNPSEYVINAEVNENVSVAFEMSNISKLPDWDYEISLVRHAGTGNIISLWKSIDNPVNLVVSIQKEIK